MGSKMKRVSYRNSGLRYTLSPYDKSIVSINPKEQLIIETEDATSGQLRSPEDVRDRDSCPFGNPLVGPIKVQGAEKGDSIVITIEEIKPTIGQGVTYISKGFNESYLTSVPIFKLMKNNIPAKTKVCKIKNGLVYFSDKFIIPYQPMIGTIGVAPHAESESISSSRLPDMHGGNMDLPDIGPGSAVSLPVFHNDALLYIGDVHAVQGDGEISGTAIEMPAEVRVMIDLKKESITWPRIETEKEVMFVASTSAGRSFEDAIRIAFLELVMWMEQKYNINRFDGLMLCSQIGRIRVGNLWTVAAKIEKKYLKS